MRSLLGQCDHRPFWRADKGKGDDFGWWAGRNRSRRAAGVDQAAAALDEEPVRPFALVSDRVDSSADLKTQRDRHASNVPSAEDGVAAPKGKQCRDRLRLMLNEETHLLFPALEDPLEHGQGQVPLVLELVEQRAARVPCVP